MRPDGDGTRPESRGADEHGVFSDEQLRRSSGRRTGTSSLLGRRSTLPWGQIGPTMVGAWTSTETSQAATSDARCSLLRWRLADFLVCTCSSRPKLRFDYSHVSRGGRNSKIRPVKDFGLLWPWERIPGVSLAFLSKIWFPFFKNEYIYLELYLKLLFIPNSDWAQILNINPKYYKCTRCKISFPKDTPNSRYKLLKLKHKKINTGLINQVLEK